MRCLSLFSGAGGLDASMGLDTVAVVEREPACWPVLESRIGAPIHSDVLAIPDRWDVDVIAGGPPCQDNSRANASGKGVDGDRSGLVWRMLDIVAASKPAAVVIENVMGLLGRGLGRVVARLEGIGYGVEVTRLTASDLGQPHRRERVLILGYRGMVAPMGDGWGRWTSPPRWSTGGDQAALSAQVRNWPTVVASDYKTAGPGQRRGQLGEAVGEWDGYGPLNPAWCEALMGWPMGWTDPEATVVACPGPVMGRGPDQHEWEPPRMIEPRSMRGRSARIKMTGNGCAAGLGAVVSARIRSVLDGTAPGPVQGALW